MWMKLQFSAETRYNKNIDLIVIFSRFIGGDRMDVLIGLITGLVSSAIVIWIVGKLGLGLSVDSFKSALIAAVVIAIVGAVVIWLLGLLGLSINISLAGAIVYLVVAAVILLISNRFLSGIQVSGFLGAIVAAIAIFAVTYFLSTMVYLLQSLLGL
jgi:putative membrane protein